MTLIATRPLLPLSACVADLPADFTSGRQEAIRYVVSDEGPPRC